MKIEVFWLGFFGLLKYRAQPGAGRKVGKEVAVLLNMVLMEKI